MVDIRRLNLDAAVNRGTASVTAVSSEQYKLGTERVQQLESVLNAMLNESYWSPEYQAWEPFVMAYLTSGVNPMLAQRWLNELQSNVPEFKPAEMPRADMYRELMTMTRTQGTEAFKGIAWKDIQEFSEWSVFFIEGELDFYKILFNAHNWKTQLEAYIQKADDGDIDSLIYAIYMYRHCQLKENPCTTPMKQKLQGLLDKYVEKFSETCSSVKGYLVNTDGVYQWYSEKVESLICNAWATSLDMTSKRHIIGAKDVFSMEVWLSEQITAYLNTLPCVMTVQLDGLSTFNALTAALEEKDETSLNKMWAYCLPRKFIKVMIGRMIDLYWDIRENRLVQYMQDRMSTRYVSNPGGEGVMSPEQYRQDLIRRGFPVV